LSSVKYFWNYYRAAKPANKIEDPFVAELLRETLLTGKEYIDFGPLEHLRYLLLQRKDSIQVTDLGAGSRKGSGNERTIGSIAKNAVSPKWQCQFLFQLINWASPQNRLEIGTSLGINTLYQYLPLRKAPLVTLEGCPNIGALAQKHFNTFKGTNIDLKIGDFFETLPQALQQLGRLDYALLDGNHQKEPTLDYFEQCLPYLHEQSVLILDDIYWSEEMQAAWTTIQKHPRVTLTIDLFYFGLVFLRPRKEKKHYKVIAEKFKPW